MPEPKEQFHPEINRVQGAWALKTARALEAEVKADNQDLFYITHSKPQLRVGTDCSGIEMPLHALKNLSVDFVHKFSSESNKSLKKYILSNFSPLKFYDDVTLRNHSKAPAVDLYIAGFPCQPFSSLPKSQGFSDEQGRGKQIITY